MGWVQRNRPKLLIGALFVVGFYFWNSRQSRQDYEYFVPVPQAVSSSSRGNVTVISPLIFIGGVPRSGTTLMRAMLDAHPAVRCGEETRVIPRMLALRSQWKKSEKEWKRLIEAGITDRVLNAAISSFLIEIISGHGPPAERLCNKDPFTMKSAIYLSELFPNSKFILMLRDGRASVGPTRCLMVHYEELVLHPESQMRRLLKFLDIKWDDKVLHHEDLVGKDIRLSKTERSTDQVVKPVNLDALSKWVNFYSADILKDMADIAPMLETLGYDASANPPNYGKPDEAVVRKTQDIHQNGEKWYEKAVQSVNDPSRVDKPAEK
ncbi:hypothetical protein QR680_009346 [Steinernema hermaphroditum]|uniref:Protein-tyrosine sulfotransferase n=1 Tax=Steinernema hermaphroditum TaxID=289476 RepID=A0AA39IJX5_9BILA|nr:hypothetical protein QR680_009346 [Steinernema hermaphroditum]